MEPPHVVIRAELNRGLWLEIVRGVIEYADHHGTWQLHLDPVLEDRSVIFDAWYRDASGVLSGVSAGHIAHLVRRKNTPIVSMGVETQGPYPAVIFDDVAVGEMACGHLHDLGLRNLAFCGMPGRRFSDERLAGMRKVARRHGQEVMVFPENVGAAQARYAKHTRRLIAWLKGLPKPVGLVVATTAAARDVVTFLRFASIGVPEHVALLGVDPDDLSSDLTTPRLTYIDQGARRLGHEAAALLDRLMRGEAPPVSPVRVPPAAVVARQSTDVLAIDDPDLARALGFVREHALEPLTVKQILHAVPMARRTLERAFRRVLGRTVHAEITRLRIDRARQLLAETSMPMAQIAAACGFERASSLSMLFTQTCGMSARDYRRSAAPRKRVQPAR